jgi:glycosyltransferase involved in cell wall biosynthesis
MALIIQATNIHTGGGRSLLRSIVKGVPPEQSCRLLVDARLDPTGVPAHVVAEAFPPTLRGRWGAERRLRQLAQPADVVLCLGNLPPLLPCRGRVYVYLQNRYLCDERLGPGWTAFEQLRIRFERIWVRTRLRPSMQLVVQTPSMQEAARRSLGVCAVVMPVLASYEVDAQPAATRGSTVRFLYPASGDPHKNHASLLAAWRLLRDTRLPCELHLTVSPSSHAATLIADALNDGVRVVNHGHVAPEQVRALYAGSTALVFPSLFESYGLPLLEARAAGLPIVASERDYVRDVVVPAETFDPLSPVSIARAVRRLIGEPETPPQPVSPQAFVAWLVENARPRIAQDTDHDRDGRFDSGYPHRSA